MKPVWAEFEYRADSYHPFECVMVNLCMIERIGRHRSDNGAVDLARLILSSGACLDTYWEYEHAVKKIDELWRQHEIQERKGFLGASE